MIEIIKNYVLILLYSLAVGFAFLVLMAFWVSVGYFFYLVLKTDYSFGKILAETAVFFVELLLVGILGWQINVVFIEYLERYDSEKEE